MRHSTGAPKNALDQLLPITPGQSVLAPPRIGRAATYSEPLEIQIAAKPIRGGASTLCPGVIGNACAISAVQRSNDRRVQATDDNSLSSPARAGTSRARTVHAARWCRLRRDHRLQR